VKSPDGAITNGGRTVIEQLNYWLMNKLNWTEHNPSATIYYKSNELDDLIDWVYQHQNDIGGLSFLPYDDHVYPLAPYEPITKEQYEERLTKQPQIDFSNLWYLETSDHTTSSQELACFAGTCEVI
jgi:ribonucleoside-triphosphate reductase